jgi:hypothetical protein
MQCALTDFAIRQLDSTSRSWQELAQHMSAGFHKLASLHIEASSGAMFGLQSQETLASAVAKPGQLLERMTQYGQQANDIVSQMQSACLASLHEHTRTMTQQWQAGVQAMAGNPMVTPPVTQGAVVAAPAAQTARRAA